MESYATGRKLKEDDGIVKKCNLYGQAASVQTGRAAPVQSLCQERNIHGDVNFGPPTSASTKSPFPTEDPSF